jgi:hypothetical protein
MNRLNKDFARRHCGQRNAIGKKSFDGQPQKREKHCPRRLNDGQPGQKGQTTPKDTIMNHPQGDAIFSPCCMKGAQGNANKKGGETRQEENKHQR